MNQPSKEKEEDLSGNDETYLQFDGESHLLRERREESAMFERSSNRQVRATIKNYGF